MLVQVDQRIWPTAGVSWRGSLEQCTGRLCGHKGPADGPGSFHGDGVEWRVLGAHALAANIDFCGGGQVEAEARILVRSLSEMVKPACIVVAAIW